MSKTVIEWKKFEIPGFEDTTNPNELYQDMKKALRRGELSAAKSVKNRLDTLIEQIKIKETELQKAISTLQQQRNCLIKNLAVIDKKLGKGKSIAVSELINKLELNDAIFELRKYLEGIKQELTKVEINKVIPQAFEEESIDTIISTLSSHADGCLAKNSELKSKTELFLKSLRRKLRFHNFQSLVLGAKHTVLLPSLVEKNGKFSFDRLKKKDVSKCLRLLDKIEKGRELHRQGKESSEKKLEELLLKYFESKVLDPEKISGEDRLTVSLEDITTYLEPHQLPYEEGDLKKILRRWSDTAALSESFHIDVTKIGTEPAEIEEEIVEESEEIENAVPVSE